MDFVSNSYKPKHRDLKISNIFGDVSDDEFRQKIKEFPDISSDNEGNYSEIAVKAFSICATSSHYTSDDNLNDIIMDHIISSTNINHPDSNHDLIFNRNGHLVMPATKMISRQLVTKLIMLSNMVAVKGRRGPATSAFVGSSIVEYLEDSGGFSCNVGQGSRSVGAIGGLSIIPHEKIPSNKVIILRKDTDFTKGINLSYDKSNNMYCLFNVGKWWESVYWFNII
jgi:hypothetical protein